MKSTVSQAQEQAMSAIEDYPLAIVLAAFGAGIAVGAAVGMCLTESFFEPPRSRTLTQKTLDSIAPYVPESLMQKLR